MDPAVAEALRRGNPVVFLDVAIGGAPAGRLRLELFKKECPKTVENFRCVSARRALWCGHNGKVTMGNFDGGRCVLQAVLHGRVQVRGG